MIKSQVHPYYYRGSDSSLLLGAARFIRIFKGAGSSVL